ENAPGPGKVPLSSMAPTFVFAPDGALLLAIGSSGGASIPTTVVQAIVHVIDDGMPVDRAIAQPRLHHNLYPDPGRVARGGPAAFDIGALTASAEAVVYGRVIRRSSAWAKAGGQIFTTVVLHPIEAWKGTPATEVTVLVPGGEVGDLSQTVQGAAAFRDGEE